MKKLLLVILIIGFNYSVTAQKNSNKIEECKTLQFILKDSVSQAGKLQPHYNKLGFYLIQNVVYDFIIDDKKYFQSIFFGIANNNILISQNWETNGKSEIIKDTLYFGINSKIEIRMVAIHNGTGGLIKKTKAKKYTVSERWNDKDCLADKVRIVSDDKLFLGRYYFTQYGFRKLKMVDGKPFICEETGEYLLRRK